MFTLLNCGLAQADDWTDRWFNMASASQAEQPHWVTPLATVTPRLEQEFRFDYLRQNRPDGSTFNNYDNGKGLEIIPSKNTEALVNLPPYVERSANTPGSGYGDLSFLAKYRLLSENEEHGNEIVTAFLGLSVPTGNAPNGLETATLTPTIAGGKGWGSFDVQSTLGIQLPTHRVGSVGRTLTWNTAFQYHLAHYFWPEIEVNDSHYFGGEHDGKNQVLMTYGVVFGKFIIHNRLGVVVGTGYQAAASNFRTYDNATILTARMPF
jgi:hypothetical protein